jgi:hypothetical protein
VRRPLALLAALVAALAGADALLGARAADRRDARQRVGALFTPDEAEALRRLPALRIELSGETHEYGRIEGRWRCLSYHQAPADERALQAWLDALVTAEGIVHARETDEAPRYGINAPETASVHLLGAGAQRTPDGRLAGDVRATLELGHALANGVVFVRRRGTREIWACAGDLRDPITRRVAPGLPPLLAPSAVPAAWMEEAGGIVEIVVERPGGGFTLGRHERALDPATMTPGMLPWTWELADEAGAGGRELAQPVAEAYVGLVERLPYAAVLASDERFESSITLTLRGHAAAPLVLALAPGADGGALLRVAATGTLYRLAPGLAELVAPAPEALAGAAADGNPWSAALEAQAPR